MSDLTMTVGELLTAVPGLRAIGDYGIPSVAASYAIKKWKVKANAELPAIESQRIELRQRHAGEGERVFDITGFEVDWAKLLADPITLHGARAVTVTELEGAARVIPSDEPNKAPEIVRGIPSDVLFALGPFVVEPPE